MVSRQQNLPSAAIKAASNELMSSLRMGVTGQPAGEGRAGRTHHDLQNRSRCFSRRLGKLFPS